MVKKKSNEEEGTHVFHMRVSNDLHTWLDEKSAKLKISTAEFIREVLMFLKRMD